MAFNFSISNLSILVSGCFILLLRDSMKYKNGCPNVCMIKIAMLVVHDILKASLPYLRDSAVIGRFKLQKYLPYCSWSPRKFAIKCKKSIITGSTFGALELI